MEFSKLELAIRKAWCRETSASTDKWTKENPAKGQCAVTACIVQDYLGGKVVWANAQLPDGITDSHYFNNINGTEIDLTREQFPEGTTIPEGVDKTKGFPTTRDYVLSFPATQERYTLLKIKIKKNLDE